MTPHQNDHDRPDEDGRGSLRSRPIAGLLVCVLIPLYVFNIALLRPKLYMPDEVIFDEHYFIDTIKALREAGEYRYLTEYTTHPPNGTILSAMAVSLFGDTPFGWRIVPLISHLIVLTLTVWLGVFIFDSVAVGALAAMLISLDGIAFGQASTLFFNAQMLVFLLAGLLLALYAEKSCSRRAAGWLVVASGICLGIAAGFRWPALFFSGPLIVVLLRSAWIHKRVSQALRNLFIFSVGALFGYITPMTLLALWGAWGSFSLYDFHLDTFLAVYNLTCDHRYNSPWWSWPILLRPVWYYFQPPNMFQEIPAIRGVVALGNPLLFALIPVAIFAHIFQWAKGVGRSSRILLVSALSMWLPWGLVNANTYIHYIYPTLPFTLLLVSDSLVSLWRLAKPWSRAVAAIVLCWTVFLFWNFYPLYIGQEIPETQWQSLMWLKSWI